MTMVGDEDLDALITAYLADDRTHDDDRPWVLLNMIHSLDGAVTVDGLSGALGNEADFAVFKTLRSIADVVLVAAGTARAEGYRPPSVSVEERDRRRAAGQAERPTIAVVTRSLRLDLDSDLFSDPDYRPVVVTVEDSDPRLRSDVAERADVVVAGAGDVDLTAAIRQIGAERGPTVLAEGGPTLNAQLAGLDLLDECCVTTSPLLVGGPAGRIVGSGAEHEPRAFLLDRAMAVRGLLFSRFVRAR